MNSLTNYFNKSLSDLQKLKIEQFCSDKDMYEAVKKVLLQIIYTQGTIDKKLEIDPQVNGAFALASLSMTNPIPDEELGKHIRSMWAGVNFLQKGFESLNTIKSETSVESPYSDNEAV